MSRREQILTAVVILLVGILVGIAAAAWLGDDDSPAQAEVGAPTTTKAAPASSSPSTSAPTTTPPTTSGTPTSTTSTTTTSTTTSTTTTTTEAPAPPPVADATNGEILGLPIGSAVADVISALDTVYTGPDTDSGWNGGCPFDGGPDDHERVISYGNLRLRFDRWDQPEQLAGWSYHRGGAGFFDPAGPAPDDIVLHDGVAWNQSANEAAAALGVVANPVIDFGITFVDHGNGTYRSNGLDGAMPFFQIGWWAGDICE